MIADTLPEAVDYVFVAEALPEAGLHRVAIAVEGLDATVPTALIAVTLDHALEVCDRLNGKLGHGRASWTAFAARRLGGGGPGTALPH